MRKFSLNVKALSVVVTTLIILVVSVLLATVVTYYAINIASTRVQEEVLSLRKVHVWVNATHGWSEAALLVINIGGRDVVIDMITVRGQEVHWSNNVYYNITTSPPSADLVFLGESNLTDGGVATIANTNYVLEAANDDIVLPSGYSIIIYIKNPDSISVKDVGTTVGIVVFSAQAQYYKECNVEAAVSS